MVMDNWTRMYRLRATSMVVKTKGFSLTELIIVMALLTFVMAAVFGLLGQAQSSLFTADTGIDLRNSLRLSSEKIALELRNTGYQNNVAQFTISDGTGPNSSDVIRFSIPILCSSSSTLLNSATSNPNYWGAPLSWGCNSYTCMDANGDCSTLEYKHIQYSINSSNQLERKILSTALTTVSGSTTIVGNDITNFQVSLSADLHVITFVLTGQKKSPVGRTITVTYSTDVLLNNLGG